MLQEVAVRKIFLTLMFVLLAAATFAPAVFAKPGDPVRPCQAVLFDLTAGVVYSDELDAFVAVGTKGEMVVMDNDGHVFFDGTKVHLLYEYKGGKPIGVVGWYAAVGDAVTNGRIGYSAEKPTLVCGR